jgi:hypothetical protein
MMAASRTTQQSITDAHLVAARMIRFLSSGSV